MPRCIVHFGLHKTGTTSIQRFLRSQLSDPRFFYPEPHPESQRRDDCHNRILCAAFMAHPEKYYSHARDRSLPEELHARGEAFKGSLARHLRAVPERTVILSAEELSTFAMQELRSLADFLMQQGRDVTYVGYVRKYKPLQESRFQEALRQGRLRGGVLTPENPRFANFPYRSRIEKFMMLSGKDAVDLRKFESVALKDGCVVSDFCSRTGIAQSPTKSPRENTSLCLEACRFLYTYRKFSSFPTNGYNLKQENEWLWAKLGELNGDRLSFHSSLFLRNETQWRKETDWVSSLFGTEMLGDLYSDDSKPCVKSEDDLLHFSADSIEWLAAETGTASNKLRNADAAKVAETVGLLRSRTPNNWAAPCASGLRQTRPVRGNSPSVAEVAAPSVGRNSLSCEANS